MYDIKERMNGILKNRRFVAVYEDIVFVDIDENNNPQYELKGIMPTTATTSKEYKDIIKDIESRRDNYSQGVVVLEIKDIYAPKENTERRLKQIEIQMDSLQREKEAIIETLKRNKERPTEDAPL